jgi:hypothetical protein
MVVTKVILAEGLTVPGQIDKDRLKKKIKQWFEDNNVPPAGAIKYSDNGNNYRVRTSYQNQQVSIDQIAAA